MYLGHTSQLRHFVFVCQPFLFVQLLFLSMKHGGSMMNVQRNRDIGYSALHDTGRNVTTERGPDGGGGGVRLHCRGGVSSQINSTARTTCPFLTSRCK